MSIVSIIVILAHISNILAAVTALVMIVAAQVRGQKPDKKRFFPFALRTVSIFQMSSLLYCAAVWLTFDEQELLRWLAFIFAVCAAVIFLLSLIFAFVLKVRFNKAPGTPVCVKAAVRSLILSMLYIVIYAIV